MSRGSEWHIWDLHVHTPESIEEHYKGSSQEDKWDKYIADLENLPKDIKVLGINDYLFIDGYRKVLDYKERGRLKNIDTILPVVEFRLAKFCGHEKFKRINYHVIFSNELTPDQIQQQFLNALTCHYALSADQKVEWGGVITKDSIRDLGKKIIDSSPEDKRGQYRDPVMVGFSNLNIEVSSIQNALSNAGCIFRGKYITAIGKTEWDDFTWDAGSSADKKDIINGVDIVFTAAKDINAYNKSKDSLRKNGVNDLLLDCSDAHYFSDAQNVKDRLGNCKTWIKAKTTFEGLKQILYEPDERVRVQAEMPDCKKLYQEIDYIKLDEPDFWSGEIQLNPNLNTIIGGRSTGKSSLLKAIAAKHNKSCIASDDFINNHLGGVTVKWKDDSDEGEHEIEYFRQSYMYEIASSKNRTNEVIEGIITADEDTINRKKHRDQLDQLSGKIRTDVYSVFQKQSEVDTYTKALTEKGNKEGVEKQLDLLMARAGDLQKSSKLNESETNEFKNARNTLEVKSIDIKHSNHDIELLNTIRQLSPFDPSFEHRCQFGHIFSPQHSDKLSDLYRDLKEKTETQWRKIIDEFLDQLEDRKTEDKKVIENIRKSDLYKKGNQAIEGNKELNDVYERIKQEKQNLEEINRLQLSKDKAKEDRDKLIGEIVSNHKFLRKVLENRSRELAKEYEGLEISVGLALHIEELQTFLEERLNQQGKEKQEYLQNILDNYQRDDELCLSDFLRDLLTNKVVLKNAHLPLDVATEFFVRKWYSLDYTLIYQGDDFKSMSEGKQAFVILKLLLDFSDKKCPILIDQPEDSLDNRAIYNELVTYIKHKKRDRQIILVTHNSNIVVGADAENVIVANQHGSNAHNSGNNKFQYINGALEDTKKRDVTCPYILPSQGIREHICDILEGGPDAFAKREKKYGFNDSTR